MIKQNSKVGCCHGDGRGIQASVFQLLFKPIELIRGLSLFECSMLMYYNSASMSIGGALYLVALSFKKEHIHVGKQTWLSK